jgi:hypothetical protein
MAPAGRTTHRREACPSRAARCCLPQYCSGNLCRVRPSGGGRPVEFRYLRHHRALQSIRPHCLGEQLGHHAVEVRLHLPIALRPATERPGCMNIRVLINLHERLERHAEPFTVIEHRAVMVGDAPGARIYVEAIIESTILHRSTHFGEAVATSNRPGAAAGAVVLLQDRNIVARASQLHGGHHPGDARTEDQDAGAFWVTLQADRASVC